VTAILHYIWTTALLAYCGLIYYLSDQSTLPVPFVFTMQDKLIHASAYAVMAFLFWQAGRAWMLRYGLAGWHLLAIAGIVFCSLYGVSDEWHQSFVSGRDASVFDWVADTIGAVLLIIFLQKKALKSSLKRDGQDRQ